MNKGGRPRTIPWERVDWGNDNVTIARQLGVPVKRVEHRRWYTGAGPARKSARQKREEAHWAPILQRIEGGAPFVFRTMDLVPLFEREGDSRKRTLDRVRSQLDTLVRQGLVRDCGRDARGRGQPKRFALTTRARLLLKAYRDGDDDEWDALTDAYVISEAKARKKRRKQRG